MKKTLGIYLMCMLLGMAALFLGVETEKQLRLLNDLQPDIYQGYLFS